MASSDAALKGTPQKAARECFVVIHVSLRVASARRHRRLAAAIVLALVAALVTALPPAPAEAGFDRYMRFDGTVGYAKGEGSTMGTGDFEVVFWAAAADWSRSSRQTVIAKWNGTDAGNGMRVQFDTVGNLQLVVKDRNGVDHVYTAGEEFLDQRAGSGRWYRIRFVSSLDGGTMSGMRVWESKASITTEVGDIWWGGGPVAVDYRPGAAPLAARTIWPWSVGARNNGEDDPFVGKVAYAHFIPNGNSSQGLEPGVVIDFRYRWRASETKKPYDTWRNAGTENIGWRMVGSKWAYVGGAKSSDGDGSWSSGASSRLLDTQNAAGALDFSDNGKIMVVQQTAGSFEPNATMFHTLSGFGKWSTKFDRRPQPALDEVIETNNGENVALDMRNGRVYVAGEGDAGTDWSAVFSYAIDVSVSTNEVKTDGKKRREYDAAKIARVKRGLSGMWVSRKNPGVHWFVVDHTYESPDGYTLFAIDSVNEKLLWRGKFEESSSRSTIRDWSDVEDLTGYKADGRWYLEIWDNGRDEVYRFVEPRLELGQSLVSRRDLRPDRIMEIHGGIVGSGNVEAMAYNPAQDAMYWVGERGSDGSYHDHDREVRRVGNWSQRAHRGEPRASLVGHVVNRPR